MTPQYHGLVPGDLVRITASAGDCAEMVAGTGIFLGMGIRGTSKKRYYSIWFNGRVATFDPKWWIFEVISED